MINVNEATTAALVAFYNENAEKPVKKFSDRKTAERRVLALIEQMESEMPQETMAEREAREDAELVAAYGATHCPSCDVHLSNGVDVNEKTGATHCLGCGHEWNPTKKPRKDSETRSAAIAKSWEDPQVAAARARRDSVEVDGFEYRSVPQAFEMLGLPPSKMVKFRMELKAAGELDAFDKHWKIIKGDKSESAFHVS